jgi:hypothetical protein
MVSSVATEKIRSDTTGDRSRDPPTKKCGRYNKNNVRDQIKRNEMDGACSLYGGGGGFGGETWRTYTTWKTYAQI